MKIIRWRFVIPVTLFTAALLVFFIFFFDALLAKGIEIAGSKINGAKVEVSGLKTKIFQGRLDIAHLQVTNREQPMQNIVEAGPLAFQLLPDQLITKRVIIPEATLSGLAFNTARKKSGALPRVAKKQDKDEKPSAAAKLVEKYKDRFSVNIDGLKGQAKEKIKFDPKDLEINKQADALKEKSDTLPTEWKKKVDDMKADERLQKAQDDLKTIKVGGSVSEITANLKKLKQVKQDLNDLKAEVKNNQTGFGSELKNLKDGVKGLQGAKEKDINGLLSKMNLDFADPQKLMEGFIGGAVLERFQTGLKYIQIAREHMPSKKEKESIPQKPRAKGMDIEFPRPADPPRFWLKSANLAGAFQDISAAGLLTNATSDPSRVGKPLRLDLKGQMKTQKFDGEGIMDHTGDVPKDSFAFHMDGFNLQQLGLGGVLGSALKAGSGSGEFALSAIGESQIGGHIRAALTGLKFDDALLFQQFGITNPTSNNREDAVKISFVKSVARSVEKMPQITIDAELVGTWADPNMKLSSNLTPALTAAIKDSVGNAVKEQRAQLEAELNNIVQGRRTELDGKLNATQAQMGDKFGGLNTKIQDAIKKATGVNPGSGGGNSPLPGVKIPDLDKFFKK